MFSLYRRIFRPRTVPWLLALFIGAIWGLVPVLNMLTTPQGRETVIETLQHPAQNTGLILLAAFPAVLGACIAAPIIRIVFGQLPVTGPLLIVALLAFISQFLGFSTKWETAGVIWILLGLTSLLVWLRYLVNGGVIACHACNGSGQRDLVHRMQVIGKETCHVCGGSGKASAVTMGVIHALLFLGIAGACFLISYASFFKHP